MPTPDRDSLTRRKFLQTGSAIAAGTALVGPAAASARDGKPAVERRRFGRTNLMLSAIGLGCASGLRSQQLGPALFNRYREELPAIVNKLLERGGNFVAPQPVTQKRKGSSGGLFMGPASQSPSSRATTPPTPRKFAPSASGAWSASRPT